MVREQLLQRGIHAPDVLDAMERVPRERFMAPDMRDRAYADGALPIECGQTISQPFMVAYMTELLGVGRRDHVLEIGTGSGYQTAVLAVLTEQVYTIEWHLKLLDQAYLTLTEIGIRNVRYRCGDGSLGWPEVAPFDGIMVTAGAPDVPEALLRQMRVGGRLVAPVGPADDQVLLLVTRTPEGYDRREMLKCRFVKLWGAQGWRE